jgi:hypothetical protein
MTNYVQFQFFTPVALPLTASKYKYFVIWANFKAKKLPKPKKDKAQINPGKI